MATVDRKAVDNDWHARGFSCDRWTDAPGRVWRDFVHQADALVMLREGEEAFAMSAQTQQPGL